MSAAIFSGGYAKILANLGIKLKDDTRILSGSVDPSVTNPSAPDGSIYLSSGFGLFVRKSSTWLKLASSDELVNSLLIQTFEEAALADFTQTGLELIASPFIHGKKTARLIHQAASNYSFKQVKPVDPKFRGKSNTFRMDCRSTADSANVTVLIKDETNNATLVSGTFTTGRVTAAVFNTNSNTTVNVTDNAILNSLKVGASISGAGIPTGTTITAIDSSLGTITISNAATATATGVSLKVSALPNVQSYAFDIPTNCSSISYTVTALQEAGLPETYVDDIVIELTDMAMTSTSVTVPKNNNYSGVIQNGITIGATTTAPTKGTIVTDRIVHSRVENRLIAEYQYEQSSANAAGSGDYLFDLPSGMSFDSNIVSFITTSATTSAQTLGKAVVGEAKCGDNAGALSSGFAVAYSSTKFRIFCSNIKWAGTGASVYMQPVGSSWYNLNSVVSYSVQIDAPIANWKTNETETKTIPLSSSVIVTEPDSYLQLNNFSASLASSATQIFYLSSPTIQSNIGDAIKFDNDSANGFRITALKEGEYTINVGGDTVGTNGIYGLSKNSQNLTTGIASIPKSELLIAAGSSDVSGLSWTGYLTTNDVVRIHNSSANGFNSYWSNSVTVSYKGSTKILNPSSDQKVEIPTHELRFEGASARGSVATAIVKFDTLAKIKGDGFEVINTAANGTAITIKKKGKLSIDVTLVSLTVAVDNYKITKNQSNLTTTTLPASEVLATQQIGNTGSAIASSSISAETLVEVGDVIRIASSVIPSSSTNNMLSLTLQEQSVSVALQNVAPRWDDSDSAVRVQQTIGYGSTNSFVRRFANVLDNFGTSVTYSDSATLGSSFTINEDGEYFITYNDNFSSGSNVAIVKNGNGAVNTPSQTPSNVLSANAGATGGAFVSCSWQGKLQKGDIIRPHTDGGAVSSANYVSFTISKVGKTQGTVDVTPFVQIPQNEVEAIEALTTTSTFGSTNTGVPVLNITKNTNKGIIQVLSSAAEGTSFKVLKDCELQISVAFQSSVANGSTGFITKNSTALTAAAPNGIVFQTVSSSISVNNMSTNIIVSTGDVIRFQRDSTNLNNVNFVTITATAISPSIATPTEQVSSDTIPFVFKATAITDSDPVGTFNTYTYAANTNTATISATAPTQSTSSMNINGIQVFARAFNAASTAAQPTRVDIKIGKELKSKQVDAYASISKTSAISIDLLMYNTVNWSGTQYSYNESRGVLTINAGQDNGSGTTTRNVGVDISGGSVVSSGYFVFNASKSPSLVSIPNLQQRVAYLSDVKPSGTAGGSSVAGQQTRTLNTIVDNTGIVTSLSANQFTLPAGTYSFQAKVPAYSVSRHQAKLRNETDVTDVLFGSSEFSETVGYAQTSSVIDGEFTITSQKSFSIRHNTTATKATNGLGVEMGVGNPEIYTQVTITKIK